MGKSEDIKSKIGSEERRTKTEARKLFDYWQHDTMEECINDITDIYGIEEFLVK